MFPAMYVWAIAPGLCILPCRCKEVAQGSVSTGVQRFHSGVSHLRLHFLVFPALILGKNDKTFQYGGERYVLLRAKLSAFRGSHSYRRLVCLESGYCPWFPGLTYDVNSLSRNAMSITKVSKILRRTCPTRTVTGKSFKSESKVIRNRGNIAVTKKYSIQCDLSRMTVSKLL